MNNDYTSNQFNTPNANADGLHSQPVAGNQGNAPSQAGFGFNADGTAAWHSAEGQVGAPVQATVTSNRLLKKSALDLVFGT